ncbi:hypothetical protein RJ640_000855 [Escallonia rubra]|uniref:Uncharacterized protein n=1 Tax=Escallonia rubra TaxID=112253 RepID=A0AA88RSD9_9ASTE|nr:hypothetical protein RJ640_000855 [Escallonia rubra]
MNRIVGYSDKLIDYDDKEKIESALKNDLEWLDDNKHAEKDDLYEKMKELKGVSNPVSEAYATHGASLAEENIRALETSIVLFVY